MAKSEKPECPYCKVPAVWVSNAVVYRKKYGQGMIWLCSNWPKCDAMVGCHGGTRVPLGTMARAPLRKKRQAVHEYLDTFWKKGPLRRQEAYELLAGLMCLSDQEAHIGMFDEVQCDHALELLKAYKITNLDDYVKMKREPKYYERYGDEGD